MKFELLLHCPIWIHSSFIYMIWDYSLCIYANLMWYLLCCKVIMYQLYPKRWSKNDHPLWAGKFSHHHAFHYSLMLYASSKDSTRLVFSHDWTKKRHNLASFIFFSFYQLLLPSVADSPLKGFGTKKWKVIKAKAKLLKKVWNYFTTALPHSSITSFTYLKLDYTVELEEIPLQNICNIENLGNAFLKKREENKFLL